MCHFPKHCHESPFRVPFLRYKCNNEPFVRSTAKEKINHSSDLHNSTLFTGLRDLSLRHKASVFLFLKKSYNHALLCLERRACFCKPLHLTPPLDELNQLQCCHG